VKQSPKLSQAGCRPFPISPPAAHRTVGHVSIDGDDVDLCVAKEPVDNIRLAAAARGGDR
jgi:hypothetical protein